jgi:predicted alpha/beta-hydrolase family hydrolase
MAGIIPPMGPADATHLLEMPHDAFALLVVGHGAGSPARAPFLAGFCAAAAELGLGTLRFDFPYMAAGRRAPDRAPVLVESVRSAVAAAADIAGGLPVLAGGKSMGGRMASMAAAEGDLPVAGLVFLGYPLHPPGRPERLRDEHLARVDVPMLFLQGTRDALARIDLLRPVVERLGPRAELVEVEGADHSFRRAGGPRDAAAIGSGLADPAAAFARRVAASAG